MKKFLSFILLFTLIICSISTYNISAATKKKVICIDAGHQTKANLDFGLSRQSTPLHLRLLKN